MLLFQFDKIKNVAENLVISKYLSAYLVNYGLKL